MAQVNNLVVLGGTSLIGETNAGSIYANNFITNGGSSSNVVAGDGTLLNIKKYGSDFNAIPFIREDGVMKIGLYVDFHEAGTDTDYSIRLMANGNNLLVLSLAGANGGKVSATAFYEASDEKLKENIKEISDLDKKIEIKEFNFKGDSVKKYGVIAQDLQKIGLDNLVDSSGEHLTVDYISMLCLKIAQLEKRLEEYEKQLNQSK